MDLDPFGDSDSAAHGVNSAGQVVGYRGGRAVVWTVR
jgi:hypothetical protein